MDRFKMSSTCAAIGCYKSETCKQISFLELQSKHLCPLPCILNSMLMKEEKLVALRLKDPPKTAHVCSFLFVDKKPTEVHPDPEVYLSATIIQHHRLASYFSQ